MFTKLSKATLLMPLLSALNAYAHLPQARRISAERSAKELTFDVANALRGQREAPAKAGVVLMPTKQGVATATKGISLAMPAGLITETPVGTSVGGEGTSHVVFQNVGQGQYRALIHIASPHDPQRYQFEVLGAERLDLQADGSLQVFDSKDKLLAVVAAPWAQDARGEPVPTHFEVNANFLTQVVEHHDASHHYGVTADPFWIPVFIWGARGAMLLARCHQNPVCKQIVIDRGIPAAIGWAATHL